MGSSTMGFDVGMAVGLDDWMAVGGVVGLDVFLAFEPSLLAFGLGVGAVAACLGVLAGFGLKTSLPLGIVFGRILAILVAATGVRYGHQG